MKQKGLVFLVSVWMLFFMTSCWSARCPRVTCRVQVEHRHGEKYYRPRAALSWMWTPRYKHVRTAQVAGAGPNQIEAKKPWYKVWEPKKSNKSKKPR